MKKNLRYAGFFIGIAILCTSLIHAPQLWDGINSSKRIWFIFSAGWLLIVSFPFLKENRLHVSLNRLDFFVLLFLSFITLNNSIHSQSFFATENIQSLGLLLFYFLKKRIYKDKDFNDTLLVIFFLLLTASQLAIATLQWYELVPSYNNSFKLSGFFYNPAPFAILVSVLIVSCLASFLFCKDGTIRAISIGLFIYGLFIVLISASRAAWLASFFGVLFVLEIRFRGFAQLLTKTGIVYKTIGTMVIAILSLLASNYLYNLKKESADGRLLIWKLSIKISGDHAISGVGTGNFPAFLIRYQSDYFTQHDEQVLSEGKLAGESWFAFNDILQLTAEHGMIGLLLLLLLAASTVTFSIRLVRGLKLENDKMYSLVVGAISALIVLLISGMFSYPLVLLPFQILFYSSLSFLSANYDRLFTTITDGHQIVSRKVKNFSAVVCILLGLFLMMYAAHLYQGYAKLQLAEKRLQEGFEIEKIASDYSFLCEDPWFQLKRGKHFYNQGKYKEAITILESAKQSCPSKNLYFILGACYESVKEFDKAEQEYKFLRTALPDLIRPRYLLTKLYYKTGQKNKWEKEAIEMIDYRPKVASKFVEAMKQDAKEDLITVQKEEK